MRRELLAGILLQITFNFFLFFFLPFPLVVFLIYFYFYFYFYFYNPPASASLVAGTLGVHHCACFESFTKRKKKLKKAFRFIQCLLLGLLKVRPLQHQGVNSCDCERGSFQGIFMQAAPWEGT
uniref:Uncharacterized protein n=1 Tax=Nomascus leucogenys TaxID=61853 RepID=A0A2I3GWS7_NOMLE